MTMLKKITLAFAAALLALSFSGAAQASLLGQTVTCTGGSLACKPLAGGVVGAGTEFELVDTIFGQEFGVWGIDLGENSISMLNIAGPGSYGDFPGFTFTLGDLFWSNDPTATITGIANFTSDGTTGMDADDVSVAANALTIDYGGSIWQTGSFISFDLVTSHSALPEPATLALFGLGLLGLGVALRRRQAAQSRPNL